MKGARLASSTPAELRRRAETDPSVVVMENSYDNVFEPWAPDRLGRCVRRVADAALAGGAAAVTAALAADPELQEFARLHPVLHGKVSSPEVAGSPAVMGVITSMLSTRREVDAGRLSEADARARVSDAALAVAAARSAPAAGAPAAAAAAPRPAGAEEDDEPRFVELDAGE